MSSPLSGMAHPLSNNSPAGRGDDTTAQKTRTVLVWCSAAHPSGGMERIAISIAGGLAARGWRVLMVGPFRNSPNLLASIAPDVVLYHYSPRKTALGVYRTMKFIQRIVRQEHVDVISAHGSLFPLMFLRTPVVWTEHDMRYGGSMLRGLRGIVWRWIRYLVRSGLWRVVTVSKHVRDHLRANLNLPEYPRVIYNGLPNAQVLRNLPPPKMQQPFQIGFVGRLTPVKHPLEVFELSTLLNRMGVPHEWSIFGDGDLMPQVREMAAKPTGHSVRVRGLAKNPQDAFQHIDLLSFLSRGEQEGLGMVLLEAMAARRRIVAWDAGCIGEVLEEHGRLVSGPFDLQRFAEAVAAELRTQDGPPQYDEDRWDEARMSDEYNEVLSEVIADIGTHRKRSKTGVRPVAGSQEEVSTEEGRL